MGTLQGTSTKNVRMSPEMVIVWNLLSQQSLGSSDPSFQELFSNQNRNSCISCQCTLLENQQGPVQHEGATTAAVQMTEAGRARGFQLHPAGLTAWLLTGQCNPCLKHHGQTLTFWCIPWSICISWSPRLSCSAFCRAAALLPSLLPCICRTQDMQRALQWIFCTVKYVTGNFLTSCPVSKQTPRILFVRQFC